jgi:hypothetical protein
MVGEDSKQNKEIKRASQGRMKYSMKKKTL